MKRSNKGMIRYANQRCNDRMKEKRTKLFADMPGPIMKSLISTLNDDEKEVEETRTKGDVHINEIILNYMDIAESVNWKIKEQRKC